MAESELLPAEPQLIKAHPESTLTHNGNGAAAGHPAENGVALPLPAPAVGLERRSNDAGANRNGLAPGGNGLAPYGIGLAPGGNGSAPGPNGFDANASTHNASTHNASTHNASTHADRAGPAAQPPRPMMARPAAAPQPPAPANAEQRRTLHLSLGGNGTNGQPAPAGPPVAVAAPAPPPAAERPDLRPPLPPRDPPPARYGYSPYGERAETRDADPGRRKEGGNFIDQELRARVDGDIAAFLAAFDAALADDTVDSRSALREATDRLLRAGARTRIELERLEARVPLAAHGDSARAEPHWRHHR
ncbi:MAG TPA: hypothetical protein VND87_14165 [Stellaceae bacterium]|nr:hypothetical protein [Stellaceae bacterium]